MTEERRDISFLNAGAASLRIDVYALLAALLAQPPAAGRLAQLAALDHLPDIASSLARSVDDLKTAVQRAEADAVAREYDALFVGIGRGEVVPYASWYEDQALMGPPLARLRRDLSALNIRRRGPVCEPEDHAAALCEIMVLIIAEPQVLPARQAVFFHAHLAPWLPRFFKDLQQAPAADFYRSVGYLGGVFMALEIDLLQDRARKEK